MLMSAAQQPKQPLNATIALVCTAAHNSVEYFAIRILGTECIVFDTQLSIVFVTVPCHSSSVHESSEMYQIYSPFTGAHIGSYLCRYDSQRCRTLHARFTDKEQLKQPEYRGGWPGFQNHEVRHSVLLQADLGVNIRNGATDHAASGVLAEKHNNSHIQLKHAGLSEVGVISQILDLCNGSRAAANCSRLWRDSAAVVRRQGPIASFHGRRPGYFGAGGIALPHHWRGRMHHSRSNSAYSLSEYGLVNKSAPEPAEAKTGYQ
jgi:hypothetical protein